MSSPRLEIDLGKICDNARTLVQRLSARGIKVMGVTKAVLAHPEVADTLLQAGVTTLGDSRIENIEALRRAGIRGSLALIRSPMISQVGRVVRHATMSFNSELDVIRKLSSAAERASQTHGIVLMVELGDLREGIMPADLKDTVQETLGLTNIKLLGIGTNLACRSGVSPDDHNMAELSGLVDSIEAIGGFRLRIVSGGNSANLAWALGDADTGRINQLRLGESILLGLEPLHRQAIDGLYTDAITLTAEVIESKLKPSQPWGQQIAQGAFGNACATRARGDIEQTILAVGRQDVDPSGLQPPPGVEILGASSDHLVVTAQHRQRIGTEITFQLNYSALVRAMTSPFVTTVLKNPPKLQQNNSAICFATQ